jgi:hypothetical protein
MMASRAPLMVAVRAMRAMLGIAMTVPVPTRIPGFGVAPCCPLRGVMTRCTSLTVRAAMLRMTRAAGVMVAGMRAMTTGGVFLTLVIIIVVDVTVDGPGKAPSVAAILIPVAGYARSLIAMTRHELAAAMAGFGVREKRKSHTGGKQQHDC